MQAGLRELIHCLWTWNGCGENADRLPDASQVVKEGSNV